MYSYFWNFINARKQGVNRGIAYGFLVVLSLVFSIPRYKEGWFYYAALAYPLLVVSILELTKRLLPMVAQVQVKSLALVGSKTDRERLNHWWNNLDKRSRFILCITVALVLALLSLAFNANPTWSRYSDALGIFYIGFMVGDILYLLLGVQAGIYQLKEFPLKLNPLDPANTVDLRKLAETTFAIAISIGFSLLILNSIIAMASYLFRHLLSGVIVVSVLAWVTIIILSIYPHLIFWQIVQSKKQETLRMLEDKLVNLYLDVKKKGVVSPNIEEMLKLQTQVMKNKSFPISGSELFSIMSTLFLNLLPLILRYFKINIP